MIINKFHELLREKGRSVTTSRTLLFEYLQRSGPVLPRQFMEDNAAVADRASLYRTLLLFRQLGVIEDRIITGKRLVELTDTYDAHHHHLTCEKCGMSTALTMPDIEGDLVALCREQGFSVSAHTIEVSGVCAACQRQLATVVR
jgi:Fur family transcriptional regulator, ferric uptake regulator